LPPLVPHFSTLAAGYELILSDVWGVVHNGVEATPAACDALMRARARGATVALITNSPRPSEQVARQLERLHVPREAYDVMVSSGDVTRREMAARRQQTVFHLGPERDRSVFDGQPVIFAPLSTADYAVCTGLEDDERETPEDYRATLEAMCARKLFMICGNPDVVVERGDKLVYCAGALADLYRTLGGELLYAGKPYRPIYEMAVAQAERAAGRTFGRERTLAIGDSIRTDLTGARSFGIDCLFVMAGIHAEELGGRDNLDEQALGEMFAAAPGLPKAVMQRLVW
jgi:HAD superfamily hydrolase (TIGR01459 family)